ncbi:MAG: sensor histidine kinase, partial [Longicatena sp.]
MAGSASLIVDNYDTLEKESIYSLVKNISSDAIWLEQLVENLLNMTRIQDGKLILKRQKEVV